MAKPSSRWVAALVLTLGIGNARCADLPACTLSFHAVDNAGKSSAVPVVSPDQVSSIEKMDTDPPSEHWFVTLTVEGGQRMLAYTAANTGGQVATFCNGRELTRATILAPFARHFVVDTSPN
jgi:hypothetical protein